MECGVFTPLVFSTTGGMGREATTFDKRLADMLAQKQQTPYPVVISWLRCKLSFAGVRSSIMCIRGTRSSFNRPLRDADTLATSEGGIPQDEQGRNTLKKTGAASDCSSRARYDSRMHSTCAQNYFSGRLLNPQQL